MRNFVILAVFVGAASQAGAQTIPGGSWTNSSATPPAGTPLSMPADRIEHTCTSWADRVYVMAGMDFNAWWNGNYDATSAGHRLSEFDPVTNAWTTLPAITQPGYQWVGWGRTTAASWGANLYQFGGDRHAMTTAGVLQGSGGFNPDALAWRYNVAARTWSQIAAIPEAVFGSMAVTAGSKIYLVGGGWRDTLYEYDPDPLSAGYNTWATKPSMPDTRGNGFAGVINGRVFVGGGAYSTGSAPTMAYDPAANSWTTFPSAGRYDNFGAAAVVDNRLYQIGGQYGYDSIYVYSVVSDSWRVLSSVRSSNMMMAAAATVTIGGQTRVYVTGGRSTPRGCNLFIPPNYGTAPTASGVFLRDANGLDLAEGAWIGATSVEFGATVNDAENNRVELQVERVQTGSAFTGVPTVRSGLVAAGLVKLMVNNLTEGAWRFQYQVADEMDNVSGWQELGTSAVDVNIDLTAPGAVAGVSPGGDEKIWIKSKHGGPIQFTWTPGTDACPVPMAYEVQVSMDSQFANLIGTTIVTGESASIVLPVTLGDFPYSWRVRAIDGAGNVGTQWSPRLTFFVAWDDGIDHGAGDATKTCGMSAHGSSSIAVLLLVLVLVARRR